MSEASPKRLYRSETDRIVAGVCGGLGDYFQVDSVIFRVIFVVLTFAHLSGLFIYIVLALILPNQSKLHRDAKSNIEDNAKEFKNEAEKRVQDVAEKIKAGRHHSEAHGWLGVVLIVLGLIFLMNNFELISFDSIRRFWPVLLVIFGVSALLKESK